MLPPAFPTQSMSNFSPPRLDILKQTISAASPRSLVAQKTPLVHYGYYRYNTNVLVYVEMLQSNYVRHLCFEGLKRELDFCRPYEIIFLA